MPTKRDLVVDTSGWAASLDHLDPLYSAISAVITATIRQKRQLVTSNYVIAELVALLTTNRKHVSRPQLVASVNAMKGDSHIEILHIDAATDDEAWKLLEARQDKAWSLVDASSFVEMWRHGMTEALTTDQHFTQAGFTRLPGP